MTETPANQNIKGDVNGDGEFSIADIVSLQKWLLGDNSADIINWENADLYTDGQLDVYDLCFMRKALIS